MIIKFEIYINFICQMVISFIFRLLGFDKLVTFVLNEWLQDIKKNQLPSLLGGVGPMHALVQLCKSCKYKFDEICYTEDVKGRDHSEDHGVDSRIVLSTHRL